MARRNLKDFLVDDTLDLSLNDLQDVPVKDIAQYPKVTSLDLSNNKLTFLSKSFATSLVHLVKLDLARNELKELPKNFGCLVNLKHLDLYKNKLENLPLSFGNLKALKWLDLKENPLEPHWQQIVGPCLNAQDCKSAAKNVVNIAGMMSDEIEAEVRSQGRQKQEIEENEQREQAKRREKQREKKRRKNAAKQAEANHASKVTNGSMVAVETIAPIEEELPEPPEKKSSENKWSVRTILLNFFKGIFYVVSLLIITLIVMKYVNEPMYKTIMLNIQYGYNRHFKSLLPGQVQKNLQQISVKIINNSKTFALTVWNVVVKILKISYVFVTADPRFEIYLNNVISIISFFYVKICNCVLFLINTVLQIS